MKIKAILFGAVFLLAERGPSLAQTMSYADAIGQIASVCKGDIARFCSGVPLGPQLQQCFDANTPRMSPQCQQTRATVFASISRRAAAQRDIGRLCDADIARFCDTSHADGHLVECLNSMPSSALSSGCSQAFTDSGWRTERARQ
jgi:hypothetical protein